MTETVTRWIRQHSHPLTELWRVREMVGDAKVVGLGASSREAHELSAVAHRVLRVLVEEAGFRALALEGDDAVRVGLDAYVRTGAGDPRALLAGARPFWRTEEILDAVRWMRAYNERRPDAPVRFVGMPDRSRVPASGLDGLAGIERDLAENVLAWHERTGDRIVYWGGLAHTTNGRTRTVSPFPSPATHRNAGSHLRESLGSDYVSVGLTFHHGSVPYAVPAPPADFADAVLGSAGPDAYVLDLRTEAPAAVGAWLDAPTRTRLIGPVYDAGDDAAHHLSGGSLREWCDLVVHVREVTPVRFL